MIYIAEHEDLLSIITIVDLARQKCEIVPLANIRNAVPDSYRSLDFCVRDFDNIPYETDIIEETQRPFQRETVISITQPSLCAEHMSLVPSQASLRTDFCRWRHLFRSGHLAFGLFQHFPYPPYSGHVHLALNIYLGSRIDSEYQLEICSVS